jgi:putative ABC transport system permease protein
MLKNYIAAALRNLLRNRLYATINIVGVAVGFAAAILVALFIRDEQSYERFLPEYPMIYRIYSMHKFPIDTALQESSGTLVDVADWLKLEFPEIEHVTRLTPDRRSIRRGEIETEEPMVWCDSDVFGVFNLPVVAGDLRRALDSPDGVVVTRAIARKYFGRDNPIGETLEIDRRTLLKVTAVIEDLPTTTHLKLNILGSVKSPAAEPGSADVPTYVKLSRRASAESIEQRMDGAIARRESLDVVVGGEHSFRAHIEFHMHLLPITAVHLHQAATAGMFIARPDQVTLYGLGAIGALILFVACLNYVNLMTARAARRAIEVGVRKASGATRWDLVTQFIGESLIYMLLALMAAVAIVELTLPSFNGYLQRNIEFTYVSDPSLSAGVLLAALIAGILAGAYPAFLKGQQIRGGGSGIVRESLVVIQFAVLIGLILAAGVIYRQTAFAMNEALRLNKDQVVIVRTTCSTALRNEIGALPGVQAVACSSAAPLELNAPSGGVLVPHGNGLRFQLSMVDFEFFELYGLQPLAGRFFDRDHGADSVHPESPDSSPATESNDSVASASSGAAQAERTGKPKTGEKSGSGAVPQSSEESDTQADAPVESQSAGSGSAVVINEELRRQLGIRTPREAIGLTLNQVRPTSKGDVKIVPSEIIGVVQDFPMGSISEAIPPVCFYIDPSRFQVMSIKLTGRSIPETLADVRRVWQRVGESRPIDMFFFEQHTQELYASITQLGTLLAIAAGIAVFIGCLGLFGLSAFTTERRTKEIGVRKALGAARGDIVGMLLWEFSRPVLWANLLVWPISFYLLRRWLQSFAYRIDLSVWMFAAVGGAALLIAWFTVIGHAMRVASAHPVRALRYE